MISKEFRKILNEAAGAKETEPKPKTTAKKPTTQTTPKGEINE